MSAWLRMHLHALGDSLGRIAAQPFASAMSILVLGIAIALPLLAAVVLRSAGAVAASLDTEPHVNVFLALDATDEDVKRIGDALKAQRDAAQARSASASTMTAAFPPSSSSTRLFVALARIAQPALALPVNVITRTRGSSIRICATST